MNIERWKWAGGGGVVMLVLLALWLWGGSGQPVYRGRSASYYFPGWTRSSGQDRDWASRWPTNAGADAVPFLVSVLRSGATAKDGWLVQNWHRGPGLLSARIPDPVGGETRGEVALERLCWLIEQPAALAELAGMFDRVPTVYQPRLLVAFQRSPGQTNHTWPLFRRLLAGTNALLQIHAGIGLLCGGEPARPLIPEIVAQLEVAEVRGGFRSSPGIGTAVSVLMARFGSEAVGALPLLERLQGAPGRPYPWVHELVLLTIRTNTHGMLAFLGNEVVPRGLPQVEAFLRQIAPPAPRPWTLTAVPEAVPFWSSLLTLEGVGRLMTPGNTDGGQSPRSESQHWAGRIRLMAIRSLAALGAEARPAAGLLTQLLSDPDRSVRLPAAQVLEGIGAVAPETLPGLIAAMPDTELHALLVPLLGRYGSEASNAVPALEAIATGLYPANWSNRFATYPRRTGSVYSTAQMHRLLDHYGQHLPDVLAMSEARVSEAPEVSWTPQQLTTAALRSLSNIRPED